MRSRSRRRAAILSLVLGCAWAAPIPRAGADIPPPPDSPETKRVPVTIELDWGVFADRVSRRHAVVAGDTLRSLAAKYLGDKERWKVIADANPALAANPDRIRVGDVLWVPPARHAETPPPPSPPGSAETAPLGPWYDAFWMEMHGNTNWALDAAATPDAVPAKYASGGSFQLLPHAIAMQFRADLEQKRVGRGHEATSHAITARVQGDGLVNKEDPTVRCVSRFRLTGVKDRSVVAETERLRYDASGALVTREWPIPPPSHAYRTPPGAPPDAPPPAPAPAPSGSEAGSAPPVIGPPPTGASAPPTSEPPSAAPPPPPSRVDPVRAPAPTPPSPPPPPAPTPASPRTPARDDGARDAKPPISPVVLVVASLVALALIGVVVALRRSATKAGASVPPPPPTSSAPPPPPPPAQPPPPPPTPPADAPAGTTEFPPGSPPPPA